MKEETGTISYLFGAGASYHALPVVDQIPKALEEFIKEIQQPKFLLSETEQFIEFTHHTHTQRQVQEELWQALEWMKTGAENHASIDTFAKKLLITRQIQELTKLKAALACFFIYLQLKNPIDKRYDSFFASLIDPQKTIYNLPDNLQILSWNYDFQFEKAYSAYSNSMDLHDNQTRLNVRPKDLTSKPVQKFGIFKLNGTTAVHNAQWRQIENVLNSLNTPVDNELMRILVRAYGGFTKYTAQFKPALTFAWEPEPVSEKVIEEAMNSTVNTEVLVVIGYSFPFFNRSIDRKIIGNMKRLTKVYFQAPDKEAFNYIDRFQAIRNDLDKSNLIPISDVDQFFLPHEL